MSDQSLKSSIINLPAEHRNGPSIEYLRQHYAVYTPCTSVFGDTLIVQRLDVNDGLYHFTLVFPRSAYVNLWRARQIWQLSVGVFTLQQIAAEEDIHVAI